MAASLLALTTSNALAGTFLAAALRSSGSVEMASICMA